MSNSSQVNTSKTASNLSITNEEGLTTTVVSDSNFTKTARLLKPADFRFVFDKPDRKYHASHIMAFVRTNTCEQPRLGLAITKKKVPTAVKRNELKRITRDNFRCMATGLQNKDIVFIAKRPINELSKQELHEQVQIILKKLVIKVT